MTYILGIYGMFPHAENAAAALVKDGKLIAMAEEERFNRIKHSKGFPYPEKSIEFCLKYAGISLKEVDSISLGWASIPSNLWMSFVSCLKRPFFLSKIPGIIKELKGHKQYNNFKKINYHPHHLSHASSAFLVSGFKEANIISMDGQGETTSVLLAQGSEYKNIKKIKEFSSLNSIGALYESFTDYLGFLRHSHEGKVMGLASYGRPVYDTRPLIRWTKNGYSCETIPRYLNMLKYSFRKIQGKKIESFSELLKKNYGPKRNKDEPLTKRHQDLAATMQNIQEKAVIKLARYLYEKNGIQDFCLAGGSSLNCISNGFLLEQDFVKNIYIQPASSDSGTALGSAFLEYVRLTGKPIDFKMEHAYWGPEYTNEEIEKVLKEKWIMYEYHEEIEKVTAELIAKGNIIGWFQGRMEVGPRALGNRSILADPTDENMKDKVNSQVKHRESFRPFCPSMLEASMDEYLENAYPSPFMILSFRVKKEKWKEIPSVVHIDGTCRPQTVTKETNPRYYKLIKEFEKIKGVPVLLNTSFNDNGESIVCSPEDAISSFKRTNLDYLAIGNFLIRRGR